MSIYNGVTYRFKIKVSYEAWGVWRELAAKIKHDKKVSLGWKDMPAPYMSLATCSKYKPKKKDIVKGGCGEQYIYIMVGI